MATSINSPNLSNAIRTDVPAINAILKALAKSDPSVLTGIENGTKRIVGENSRWSFQEYVDGSWITRKQFNIDATSVDGKTLSSDATANTIALRDADGKLAGDIKGNAATASKATALASTLAVAGGGTGATTAAAARTNLGVPPTSHASTGTSYGVSTADNYGHAKASATTPKALGTASAGSETASFARGDHVHPTTTATDSVLGMVKLSDSTTSTSAASAGIAASPAAVKAAMDKATSAATDAANAATAAANAQTAADGKLSSIGAGTGISVSGSTVSLATVVTAGNGGPTANATLSHGGTFTVPYFTYDAYGRITGRTNRTLTLPAAPSVTSISGNAATATRLQTARTITIPRADSPAYMTGVSQLGVRSTLTVSFNGANNVTFGCGTCSTSCSGGCINSCAGCGAR